MIFKGTEEDSIIMQLEEEEDAPWVGVFIGTGGTVNFTYVSLLGAETSFLNDRGSALNLNNSSNATDDQLSDRFNGGNGSWFIITDLYLFSQSEEPLIEHLGVSRMEVYDSDLTTSSGSSIIDLTFSTVIMHDSHANGEIY